MAGRMLYRSLMSGIIYPPTADLPEEIVDAVLQGLHVSERIVS